MSNWTTKKMKIREKEHSLLDFLIPRKPTGNFYESSYVCPYCGDWLYKTVFPIGREYSIQTNTNGITKIKRVFGCASCQIFLTAAIDKLSDGLVYELKLSNKSDFQTILLDMNSKGTTEGRPD